MTVPYAQVITCIGETLFQTRPSDQNAPDVNVLKMYSDWKEAKLVQPVFFYSRPHALGLVSKGITY